MRSIGISAFDRSSATYARQWLYDHKILVAREKDLRAMLLAAIRQFEASLGRTIQADVGREAVQRWRDKLVEPHQSSLTTQSWLWAPTAKHSTRQIAEMLERIDLLYELKVQHRLQDQPDDLMRRYARRLASRPPSAGRLIVEPGRSIEVACFLRYSLLLSTDRLLMMVRRRVADLWRLATKDANKVLVHWADLYRELLASVTALANDANASDTQTRERLRLLVTEHGQRKPPTCAQLIRDHLTLEIGPVRSLLTALIKLPWDATAGRPVLAALKLLKSLYEQPSRELPLVTMIDLGRVWQMILVGDDRAQAFRAFEVASLILLRRALRNGTVWIDHSLAFRSRERLFIPPVLWEKTRNSYYQRLSLPKKADSYDNPIPCVSAASRPPAALAVIDARCICS